MASDCIFFIEDHDMGATSPFCNFENSSDWNCCKYFYLKNSTQELCPHYISRKDVLMSIKDTLRREIIMSDAIMSIGKETAND